MRGTKMSPVFANYFMFVFSIVISLLTCSNAEKPVALFLFGDSIFDAGNNNYINTTIRANFFPYGETFFGYPTGRFTNGRTVPDFISEYAKLPLIPPYLQPGFHDYSYGVNFASGGAGVLPETRQGLVIDLRTQVSYFNDVEKILRHELGSEEETNAFLSSAVYLFSVGGNDYFDAYNKSPSLFYSQHSLEEYVDTVIGNLTNVVQEIYNTGGRKFGFHNLSPIGCIPALRALKIDGKHGCVEELVKAAKLHNKALSYTLQKLAYYKLHNFKYSILDIFTFSIQGRESPSKYGFKEVEMACCGSGPYRGQGGCGGSSEKYELCDDPSEYIYFDRIHPTEKVYQQLAELFWTGDSKMAWPYHLKQFFEMGK